jgi:hypothetical protein
MPPTVFRNLLKNVYQTPTTCNALMRRSAIADVGGFDESFTGDLRGPAAGKILLHIPGFHE